MAQNDAQDIDTAFAACSSNAERREFVVNALANDTLSGKARDFFIEQFNKGELFDGQLDEQTAVKLASVLNLKEKTGKLENGLLEVKDVQIVAGYGGNMADLDINKAKYLAESLTQEVKKNRARMIKTAGVNRVDMLVLQAQHEGQFSYGRDVMYPKPELKELTAELTAKRAQLKWYNPFEKRKVDSQLRAVDPEYYSKKAEKSGKVMGLYYRWRDSKRHERKVGKLEGELNKTFELQSVVSGTRFWSKNMIPHVWARTRLAFRRSPENKAKQLTEAMKLGDLNVYTSRWEAELAAAQQNFANSPIKDDKQMYQAQIDLLQKRIEIAQKAQHTKSEAYHNATEKVTNNTPSLDEKFIKGVRDYAAQLEAQRMKAMEKDPELKMYQKILEHTPASSETRKKLDEASQYRQQQAITPDRVFESLMRDQGFTDEQIIVMKKQYFPEFVQDDRAKPGNVSVPEENREQGQADEQRKPDDQRQEDDQVKVDEPDRDNTSARVVSKTRENGETVDYYPDSGLEVSKPDENTFNISGKDGAKPQEAQFEATVKMLQEQGYDSINLQDGCSPEFYKGMLAAAEKNGMKIENREAIEKLLKEKSAEQDKPNDSKPNDTKPNENTQDDKPKKEADTNKVEWTDDGKIKLTKAQRMALDAEGRLDMGVNAKKTDFTFEDLSSENKAYLEELGLGEKHIKDQLKKDAESNQGFTQAQRDALDAEGRLDSGGLNQIKDLGFNSKEFGSENRAYLEAEGLGHDYNKGKAQEATNFMADAMIRKEDVTAEKMDMLVSVRDMKPDEYAQFKETSAFKKLPAHQKKLVNAVNALSNNQDFRSKDERKQAVLLGRIVGQYKAAVEKSGAKDKKAKQNIINRDITRHVKGGRD